MIIKTAEFIKGAVGTESLPNDKRPQIAFVGRSNVGKSSLINSLTGRKGLAISSSTPGRTLQLNFFLINDSIYFVDLPGYGYSKISLKQAEKTRKMIMWYFQYSGVKPKHVILVVDAKVGPTKFDLEMKQLLEEHGHDIIFVANKADKLKQKDFHKKDKEIKEKLEAENIIYYSTVTGKGREQLLAAIEK